MEIKGKVHCFFEQSGTFKNEFIKLGIPAEDYDIQDNFGQTDHVIDLFDHIEMEYDKTRQDKTRQDKTRQDKTRQDKTIFDDIKKDDLIIAFFPCIYFCSNNTMLFYGSSITWKQQHKTELEINEMILQRSRNRQKFYELVLKMFSVCTAKSLRLIMENPHSPLHYLNNNFPYKPRITDVDRSRRGDNFKKPTDYWFHNCEPTNGFTFQPKKTKPVQQLSGHVGGLCSEERSMISPDYARNFICDFIIGKKQDIGQLSLF